VTGAQVISAKWRREPQPSRRLTAREKAPPLGRSQFPCALLPGQPSGSRRWHPCCRRCLLKDCECWFLPRWPQARYCGPTCQDAARRWQLWQAGQIYRATARGKERRREQSKRHRVRVRQRSSPTEPAPPSPLVEPVSPVIEAETPPTIDPPPVIPAAGEGLRSATVSRPRRSADRGSPGDAPPVGDCGCRGRAGQETLPNQPSRYLVQAAHG
jgi:hypothetical protein